jgi:hypothetical protein
VAVLEEALRLVADRYRDRGYEPASGRPCRFTPHHALPGTATLVARHGPRVLATLTVVPDNRVLGLPMEAAYAAEVRGLRGQGLRLSEFTGLAARGLAVGEFLAVFKALIHLGMQYHLRCGGDVAVSTAHPRHRAFYSKMLGAEALGPRRAYAGAGGHPAEAWVLHPGRMKTAAPGMYRDLFEAPLPDPVLSGVGWSAERVRYLSRRSASDPAAIEAVLAAVEADAPGAHAAAESV